MLFVTYSRRVRQSCVSAIAGGAAQPPRPAGSKDRANGDEPSAPRSSHHTSFTSLPALYDRTPERVVTSSERHPDR